ncbi:DUF7351 domain-containing protein [Halobaculum sp. P14]|uniref:DUF7351 domain-containing protein n=1 Tax=Halobaculum sp. P14 TaxID=3421638 RepID=UPI003EBA8573
MSGNDTGGDSEPPAEPPGSDDAAGADDAFGALGNETRLRTLRRLAAADEPPTFTELFEASGEDTSAGFAYHLRQLVDRYVRKDEETERYHLTYAGREVTRALDAGTYTDRVDREPEPVDDDCPVCGAAALAARVADNYVAVACTDCGTELLSLPFPPSGARDRDADEALAAFDSYHRSRLRLLADGVCPDCAGDATGRIEFTEPDPLPGDERRPVLVGRCSQCQFGIRTPVSLAVVTHPAVAAFFSEHGESVRDRPLWNLGPEWSEAVLSTSPPAVRVSIRLGDDAVDDSGDSGESDVGGDAGGDASGDASGDGDGEVLRLLVGDGPTVVDVTREAASGQEVTASGSS